MATYYGNLIFGDTISAGSENDTIYGFAGDDILIGNIGADTIYGGWGRDTLRGGTQNDTLFGEDDDDTLNGDGGDDTLYGGNGIDTLNGGTENDMLDGGALGDRLNGDSGNDTFKDFSGNNTFNGGTGTDTADYTGYGGGVSVTLAEGAGNATASRTATIYVVGAGPHLYADGSDTLNSIENVKGGVNNDIITGNSQNNVLSGNGGNDILSGGGGIDTLSGGYGQDYFVFKDVDRSMAVTNLDGSRTVDRITDFRSADGDYIDLRSMDANGSASGNGAFSVAANFTGSAGELLIRQDDATHFRLIGDTNGDGFGDMFIDIATNGAHTIAQLQGDILL